MAVEEARKFTLDICEQFWQGERFDYLKFLTLNPKSTCV